MPPVGLRFSDSVREIADDSGKAMPQLGIDAKHRAANVPLTETVDVLGGLQMSTHRDPLAGRLLAWSHLSL